MKPKSALTNNTITEGIISVINRALTHNSANMDILLKNGSSITVTAYIEGICFHQKDKYKYTDEIKSIVTRRNKYVRGLITERVFIENVLLLSDELFTVTQIKSIIKKIMDVNSSESPTTTSKVVDKKGLLRFVQNEDLDIISDFSHSDIVLTNTSIISPRIILVFSRSGLSTYAEFKHKNIKH